MNVAKLLSSVGQDPFQRGFQVINRGDLSLVQKGHVDRSIAEGR